MNKFKTVFVLAAFLMPLAGCSTNPATGQQQFAALMSPSQENQAGAQEHSKILKTYGAPSPDDPMQQMVNRIGARVSANTERPEVSYKFFVLDSPIVNAFALPGGYIYVSRGLLAQANSEAELAGVLAHETAHITARHSAERYSRGVLASLGAVAIAAATKNAQAARAAGIGSDLYIKSYSRQQESQADELGIRYLSRAGYDPYAMASFLQSLEANDDLQQKIEGNNGGEAFSYFSTHPRTTDRVVQARTLAAQYPSAANGSVKDAYLQGIDGLVYGDSARQGFLRKLNFWHPDMGFTFEIPKGFTLHNEPDQIVAVSQAEKSAILFDQAPNQAQLSPALYIQQSWMKGGNIGPVETMDINGMKAATASFPGNLNNVPVTIRLVAVAWTPDRIFRFQIAFPQNPSGTLVEGLKRTTYSLRPMSQEEKRTIRPYRIDIVTGQTGDSVTSLSSRLPFDTLKEERFRTLNGLNPGDTLTAGRPYKIIVE